MSRIDLGEKPRVHVEGVVEHGMGRLPAPDPKDGLFKLSAVRRQLKVRPDAAKARARGYRHWGTDERIPINQGATPRCVGYSIATVEAAGPVTQRGRLATRADVELAAEQIYCRALQIDEWDGEVDAGTSVRAGLDAAIEFGAIGGYAWADTVLEMADFILSYGPAEIGVIWPDSMMEPDTNGYLIVDPSATMDGRHAAGHAIAIVGVNTKAKNPDGTVGYFEPVNTWGDWGREGDGKARITFAHMALLKAAGGEFALPTEIPLKPVVPKPLASAARKAA